MSVEARQAAERDRIQALRGGFRERGYVLARQVIGRNAAMLYAQSALMQRDDYWMPEPAYQARGRYADAFGEAILAQLTPLVSEITGRRLEPCYSFLRIYQAGSQLRPHRDRPSCEFSVTMHVGKGPGAGDWPIWIEGPDGPSAVSMEPGDLMVYRGAALSHWREPFHGDVWVQLFLHYVDADGPYAHYRYDGRRRLGAFRIGEDQRDLPDPSRLNPEDGCWCGSGLMVKGCHPATLES
ncbi:hypothetical protein VCB98_09330 [Gammaproteobacteria bacterium AB-CW1]|uniref:Uncharacterized protein n=1 Tax=Natronospira elongata TaxID=3110268 RepID=A0AAP6JIT3_9GAMM|nr:hypothetical protein [Gammaproteobacteria bacterium AB-CW1]